ncbi:RNA polymerase sigma factor [Streptomyces sp. NPDC048567]|uniref:RNA polymerase sigma factor n=1 Tax=Streptomyces sp. NPDC048567 TaxID=3365570 RepID=UPI003714D578
MQPAEGASFWGFHQKTLDDLRRTSYALANGHLHDAEDAVQEAYLAVMKKWPFVADLPEPRQVAYLKRTLLNVFRQRWRRLTPVPLSLEGVDQPSVACEAADHVMAADRYRRVCRAIAALPEQQSRVMTLYGLEGLEVAEVAQQLAIAPATVRGHLLAARSTLKLLTEDEVA